MGHVHPSAPRAVGATGISAANAAATTMIDLRITTGDASALRGSRKPRMTLL
jgi:hypothetical protein